MNPLALSLAVLGSAVLLLAQDDPDVRIESLAGPLLQFARGGDEPYQVRVVHALTQQPLPGALLDIVRERSHPTGGEFWCDSQWQADADGFVRFPGQAVPADCWVLVGADGFGTLAASKGLPTFGDGVVELMPGVDWPLDVRDAFDRPLGGVEVGLCLGCGHTPDVRWATSDLLGRAVLRADGPWTLREGSARLRLRIVDDHGMFADGAVVLCGATAKRLRRHTVELQGLPAGAGELFAGASSCDSAKVRVVLKEGEERRLDIVPRRRL